MKTKKKNKLPDKLSELLRVAMADLAAVEKSKEYRVNMGTWHEGTSESSEESCEVCLAGAVMAQTLETPIENYVEPYDLDEETRNKLLAIDALRTGDVCEALQLVSSLDRDVAGYHSNKSKFKADMKKLIKDLEKAGL